MIDPVSVDTDSLVKYSDRWAIMDEQVKDPPRVEA